MHLAGTKGPLAIAIDRSGKLHFAESRVGGDSVVALHGHGVPDAQLTNSSTTVSPTSSPRTQP